MVREALALSTSGSLTAMSPISFAAATSEPLQNGLVAKEDDSQSIPAVNNFGMLDDNTTTLISDGSSASVSNNFPYSLQYLRDSPRT